MRKISIRTDRGLIMRSETLDENTDIAEINTVRVPRKETPWTPSPSYFELIISGSNRETTIKRDYFNVIFLLAAIGGIHRGITLLFGVFGGAASEYSYITTLIGGRFFGLGHNQNFPNTQNYSFKKKIWYYWFCGPCCSKKIGMQKDSSEQYENF